MANLVQAAADDLNRLIGADWGIEIQIVGSGFLTVQLLSQTEPRKVGEATTPRQSLRVRTDQDFATDVRIVFSGVTYRIAGREENEGLFTYDLDQVPATP